MNNRQRGALRRLSNGRSVEADAVRAMLREIIERDYDSLSAMAATWRVSKAYLSDVLNGRREPGPAILRPLGLRRVVTVRYVAASEVPHA